MKQLTIILALITLTSFTQTKAPVKTLKAELKPEEWQLVLDVIEQSNAPHT